MPKAAVVLLDSCRLGRIAASLGNAEELSRLALEGMRKAETGEAKAIQVGILNALRPLL